MSASWSTALAEKIADEPLTIGTGWSASMAERLSTVRPANRYRPLPRPVQATPYRMTAAGRTLSDEDVVRLTENGARALFARARWPNGKPICGKCSSARCSPRTRPGYYRCLDCKTDFSATTGTTLQSHKLPLRRIFAAIFYLMVLPYGVSSASLSVLMALSPNTTFVLLHRIREAIATHVTGLMLSGEVEIDGVYFSCSLRRPNVGRRSIGKLHAPTRKGRCVLTLKQRGGPIIPVLVEGETCRAVLAAVRLYLKPGTRIYTDDLNSYDFLHAFFKVQRVNHSVHYVNGTAHTNGAESFHGRLRKAQSLYGRFVPGDDFMLYVYEMAFKHAAGKMDTRSLWESVIRLIASQPVSERFCNYWQGIRSMAA